MSDPVTTAEATDLLSSVRRLVVDTPDVVAEPEPQVGRLVLTPSFRVDDAVEAEPVVADAAEFVAPQPEPEEAQPTDDVLTLMPEDSVDAEDASADETAEVDPAVAFFGTHDDRHARLEATIAELEEAVLSRDEEFEPDGSEATVEFHDWEDATPIEEPATDGSPDPAPEIDMTVEDNDLDDVGLPAGDWDEEALRDLIADVLREELRGEVGERITRNVRKLIRREIYRVLTTEGMDA